MTRLPLWVLRLRREVRLLRLLHQLEVRALLLQGCLDGVPEDCSTLAPLLRPERGCRPNVLLHNSMLVASFLLERLPTLQPYLQ